jgi:hypothetical protein
VSDEVWLGLRCDGVELDRIWAMAEEVERSNGIAKWAVTTSAVFTNVTTDCQSPALTVHDGPHEPPFAALRLSTSLEAGSNLWISDVKFERVLDVPRKIGPDRPRWLRRLLPN